MHSLFFLSLTARSVHRETIFPVVREFAAKFLDSAANSVIGKVFAALEIFIRACPELTRGTETIFGILSGIISDIERRRRTGTETEMRCVPFSCVGLTN